MRLKQQQLRLYVETCKGLGRSCEDWSRFSCSAVQRRLMALLLTLGCNSFYGSQHLSCLPHHVHHLPTLRRDPTRYLLKRTIARSSFLKCNQPMSYAEYLKSREESKVRAADNGPEPPVVVDEAGPNAAPTADASPMPPLSNEYTEYLKAINGRNGDSVDDAKNAIQDRLDEFDRAVEEAKKVILDRDVFDRVSVDEAKKGFQDRLDSFDRVSVDDAKKAILDRLDRLRGQLTSQLPIDTGRSQEWFDSIGGPLASGLRTLGAQMDQLADRIREPILPGARPLLPVEEFPKTPERAMNIVGELKSSAALFAAFAFGALNLPGTLIISESRVTSAASSVSTSRPVPDSDLLQAFVVLDVATFGFMLICVVVSQQLLYRLADGSYGTVRFGTDEEPNIRDTALGRLTTQYGAEWRTARAAFDLGIAAILLATVLKTWAVFDSSISLPVTAVIVLSSLTIGAFYVRNNRVFRQLETDAQDLWTMVGPATLTAAAIGILFTSLAALTKVDANDFVTADVAFQRVVTKMQTAAAAASDAQKAAAESLAEVRLVEATAVAEQAALEKAAAEKVAADKKSAAAQATNKAQLERARAEKVAAEKVAALETVAKNAAAAQSAAATLSADKAAGAAAAAEKQLAERVAAQKAATADKAAVEQQVAARAATVALTTAAEKTAMENAVKPENVDAKNTLAQIALKERLSAEQLVRKAKDAETAAEAAAAEQTASMQAVTRAAAAEKMEMEKTGAAEAVAARAEVEKAEAEKAAVLKSEMAEQAAKAAAVAEAAAEAAAAESAVAEKAFAQKAVAERVASEKQAAAEKTLKKAKAAKAAADLVVSEKAQAEKAAGAPMRAAADRAEAERVGKDLAELKRRVEKAATVPMKAAADWGDALDDTPENIAKSIAELRKQLEKAQQVAAAPVKAAAPVRAGGT